MNKRGQAKWIWLPGFVDHDTEVPGRFVLFRKTLVLAQAPQNPCFVNVSADTRYRLFINGTSVAFGPCKSYPSRWYYETIDLAPHLRAGINIIAAKVLRFFPGQIGSSSLMKTHVPGFILWGQIEDVPILTDESWQCREDTSIQLQPRSEWNYILGPPFLSLDERVDASKSNLEWQVESADLSTWKSAVPAIAPVKMMPALEPWKLFERPIPLLPEIPCKFDQALRCSGRPSLENWNSLIQEERALLVEANEQVTVEFETSKLTTGFLEFDLIGGRDAEVTVLYAECYEKDLGIDKSPFPIPRTKSHRRDYHNGRLYGMEDHLTLAGTEQEIFRYEPFWFRTFRFIRLSIRCKEVPVTIQRIAFRETKYPLEITTKVRLPSRLTQIWDMCVTTLRNCMHETYEDCPFYEQNQFAMDGRLQLLFTYQLSRDDRLTRKTIHEFHASRRDDGLLETNSPCSFNAINIPQFSLFWIMMLHDHMQYFNDRTLIRQYIGTVDGILSYFHNLIDPAIGLIGAFDPSAWAFVDWVPQWSGNGGPKKDIRTVAVPPVYTRTGIAAYNSLLYSLTLQRAADLNTFISRPDTAAEYRLRATTLNERVQTTCFTGTYFLDGPDAADTEISEHVQVFAVLADAITGSDATDLMRRVMDDESDGPGARMPRCSHAMKHYVFRALARTGLYDEYFDKMIHPWREMLEVGLTTCPESEVGTSRSDCHAWSAGVVYEIVAEVFGARPGADWFGAESGKANGSVKVNGMVGGYDTECEKREENGKMEERRELLERARLEYVLPGGRTLIREW